MAGKQQKPKPETQKKMKARREPTPSVESQYQVAWLVPTETETKGKGKKKKTIRRGGVWSDEDATRTSFGRRKLARLLRKEAEAHGLQFRIRLVQKGKA